MPFRGIRPLAAGEFSGVRSLLVLECVWAAVALLSSLIASFWFVTAAGWAGAAQTGPLEFSAGLTVLCFGLAAWGFASLVRSIPRAARLIADVRDGMVERYSFSPEPDRGIEVLMHSGVAWTSGAARVFRFAARERRVVASIPPYATIAAQWLEPIRHADGRELHGGQRELSISEIMELRHIRRETLSGPVTLAVTLTACFSLVCERTLAAGMADTVADWWLMGPLLALTVLAWVRAVKAMRMGRRLSTDLRIGRVGIVRHIVEEVDQRPTLGEPAEILAVTGVLWSRAGRPAPWRTGSPAA